MTTKERILRTAMKLFSSQGLDGVSVRTICEKAAVNVAMVNYHFRNKEGLYRECLARLFMDNGGEKTTRLDEGVTDADSWKAAVGEWIRTISAVLHAPKGESAIIAGFFRREVVNPSSMHELVLNEYLKPVLGSLDRLLKMAIEDAGERFRWMTSIWAQIAAYALVDPVWHPVFRPTDANPQAWGATFADFICQRVFAELHYQGR